MAETTTANRQIIYDSPAQTDAFTGGGHARTANALARLIRTFNGETRAIGLEGRWGSGKSSIVEMAKKTLETGDADLKKKERRSYHIFTYDLWAHQTGNFRRTFLEQLIAWLEMQPQSDEKSLKKIYDQITNRTIRTRTDNTKVFSVFGVFSLIFILSLPLVYMWLSPFAFVNSGAAGRGYSMYALMVILAMTVLTVFRIGYIWRTAKGRLPWLGAVSQTLSLFSKDAEITNIEQRIREIDPSQHEFEETFKDIIAGYQTDERRLIIVFDNVDRLPADKINDAWANVRAIVSANRTSDGADRKIILITPYDREHILNAIKTEGDDSKVQEDLLRKSFDAILFVAPPVISDASAFFDLKLEEALGNHVDKEFGYRVYKIFDLSCRAMLPTPRQIIAFINAISGLWEQWEGRIPLPTVALFMANREKLAGDPTLLRRPDEIDERQRDLAGDADLFKNLAALAYNVEPEHALQVLLHGKIEELFTNNKSEDEVNEIVKAPGWDTILPDVYREKAPVWADTSPVQFRNAVRNLTILDAGSSQKLESKRSLLSAIGKLSPVAPTAWEDQEELLMLFDLCDSIEGRKLTIDLYEWLQRSLPKSEERMFVQGSYWIKFTGMMHKALVARYGEGEALEMIAAAPFPDGDEFLVGVAYDTDQTDLHLKDFKKVPRAKNLVAALESRLTESPIEFYYSWPEVRYLVDKTQPAAFAETLGTYLRDNKPDDVDNLRFMLKSYNDLIASSISTDALIKSRQSLVNNGALYHYVNYVQESQADESDEALAAIFWLILSQSKGKSPPASDFQSHAFGNLNKTRDWINAAIAEGKVEDDVLSKLAEWAEPGNKLSEWIEWAAAAPKETSLLQTLIVKVVQKGDYHVTPPAPIVSKHYEFLKELLDEDLEALLVRVATQRKPEEWSALDPEELQLSFIADNAKRQEQGWRALYSRVDQWLVSHDADVLKQALFDETHLILALRQRVKDAGITIAPEKLKTAITEHILAMLSGERQSQRNFDAVWNAVPKNSRTGLATDILDHLERTVVTSAGFEVALACYPALIAQLPLIKRPDVAARKVILPLIESALKGTDPALSFLKASQKTIQRVIKEIEDDTIVGEFQDHLDARSS